MESLFEQVAQGRIWPLQGGVHPPACKENTSGLPIIPMPLPEVLVLPLKQHIGEGGKLLVSAGDKVLKGQPLTEPVKGLSLPIHAPTSGTVIKIEAHPVAHPSALSEPCLFLAPDGQEQWVERKPMAHFCAETPEYLVSKIKQAGISGLGGAGFPAYIKSSSLRNINYLIVNATECESYITADESLIRRSAENIIQGIDVIANIVNPNMILIGIEDDKPEAIKALEQALEHRHDIHLRVFPAKYPSGGEKQLIKILTGEEVPSGGYPVDVGILVHNVGTLYAVYKAVVEDEPLISRIVTVTGEAIEHPQNLEVLLGTPVEAILSHCGFNPGKEQRVIMGGPMMGFTLPHTQIPVVKITNCVLAPAKGELPEPQDEMDCIRCGACADACPVSLLPQQMLWYAKAKDLAKTQEYNIKDCIECGACAYVCPSEIPLVQYYRVAKAEIRTQEQEKRQAEHAKQRFEARQARLAREAEQRAEKQRIAAEKRKKAMASSGASNAVADALARVKAKKAQQAAEQANTAMEPSAQATKEEAKPLTGAAAAVAKAKARKAAQAAQQTTDQVTEQTTSDEVTGKEPSKAPQEAPADDKKAAIAAAVAKAKARKAAQGAEQTHKPTAQTDEAKGPEIQSDKKAAIAAAVAKAKARKAAQQTEQTAVSDSQVLSDEDPSQQRDLSDTHKTQGALTSSTDKKAAIAKAVAKAKARKAAQEQTATFASSISDTQELTDEDKPQRSELSDTHNIEADAPEIEEQSPLSAADAKKAAIAAAVAKAKARKLAKAAEQANDEPDNQD